MIIVTIVYRVQLTQMEHKQVLKVNTVQDSSVSLPRPLGQTRMRLFVPQLLLLVS